MATRSDHEWDLFISYARADKYPDPRSDWISKFKEKLSHEIEGATGRRLAIFFDETSQRFNEPLTSILDKVRRSRIFLAIGSPNYVGSDWCLNEARAFHERNADVARTFVAELRQMQDENPYPEPLAGLLHARFWYLDGSTPMTMSSGEKQYKRQMAVLTAQISQALRDLNRCVPEDGPLGTDRPARRDARGGATTGPNLSQAAPATPAARPSDAKPAVATPPSQAVLVGYGPEEVWEERESLINYLGGLGIEMVGLPAEAPRTEDELDPVLADLLGKAGLYVQLLGRRKGRPLEGSADTVTQRQWAAAELRLPAGDLFLWRPADIEPELNPDDTYKPLRGKPGIGASPSLPRRYATGFWPGPATRSAPRCATTCRCC